MGLLIIPAGPGASRQPRRAPYVAPAGGTATTTTTATVSTSSPSGNEAVRISIRVAPYGGRGDVEIRADGGLEQTVRLRADGTAVSGLSLEPGAHTILVRYLGFRDWLPSQAAPMAVEWGPYDASRVSVIPPTGSLQALNLIDVRGTTPLATAEIRGGVAVTGARRPDVAGTDGSPLLLRDHKLFPGDWEAFAYVQDRLGRNLDMVSCPVDLHVTKRGLTPTLTSPDLTIDWSQSMVLDYVAGPAASVPSEAAVTYHLDGASAAVATDQLIDGRRRTALTPDDIGTIQVTARLEPSEFLTGPARTLTFSVVRGVAPKNPATKAGAAPTTTTMAIDPAASQWDSGAPVTITVSPATGGRVILYSGARSIGETTLNGAGQGVIRLRTLPPGSHPLVAIYQGTARFAPSRSAKQILAISWEASTTTLELDRSSIQVGGSVTATATVSPKPARGAVFIGGRRVELDPETGSAQTIFDQLPPGTHAIEARFDGYPPYGPSRSGSRQVTVDGWASTSSFSVSTGIVGDGPYPRANATATVLVEPEGFAGDRNGDVDLFVDGRRVRTISYPASTKVGVWLNPGRYELQVKYRGNRSLEPSVSEVQTVQIGDRAAPPRSLLGDVALIGPSTSTKPVVKLRLTVDPDSGPVRGFQISNDGSHWATWWFDMLLFSPTVTVPWSLTECGADASDGPRTVRVRFLAEVIEEQGTAWIPVPAGGALRSAVKTVQVTLDR